MAIRGLIFDLDGTLVDSGLDFELMRREMELPSDLPLLESIERLPRHAADRCMRILHQHESEGAARAVLFPGVREFLEAARQRGLSQSLFTRNSRNATRVTLDRLQLSFDPIMCREDGPTKPHPAAIWKICGSWGFLPRECLVIGDYDFDIEAGRRAGSQTVQFTGSGQATSCEHVARPDFVLPSFQDTADFWLWLAQIDLGGRSPSC